MLNKFFYSELSLFFYGRVRIFVRIKGRVRKTDSPSTPSGGQIRIVFVENFMRCAAVGGTWVPGGGKVLPCMIQNLRRNQNSNRDVVRNVIESVDFNKNDVE